MNMVHITTVHLILATILMNLEVRFNESTLVIENIVRHGTVFKCGVDYVKSFSADNFTKYQMIHTPKINILYSHQRTRHKNLNVRLRLYFKVIVRP